MATRIITWLKQSETPFSLLGCVLQNYMEAETEHPAWIKGREAITAACAIVESLCKIYIAENGLTMPSDQSIRSLWKTVQEHLGLGPLSTDTDDLKQILGGLGTVLNGVGALRTHAVMHTEGGLNLSPMSHGTLVLRFTPRTLL
jgi:hypothetical protein